MISITTWLRHDKPHGVRHELCLDDVFSLLARPVAARQKDDLSAWGPTVFRGDYRNLENVERVFAAGVDVDGDATLGDLLAVWSHVFGYVHSTASSTPSAPRWRIVIVFSHSLACDQARRVIKWAQRRTPGKIDTRTHDPSRLWYLPWAGAAHWAHAGLVGDLLDVDAVLAELDAEEERRREEAVPRFVPPQPTTGAYGDRALSAACRELALAIEGESRNNTLSVESFNMGTLITAGLIGEDVARSQLRAAVAGWSNQRKTLDTLERQLREGMKHPRTLRASRWI